MAAEPEPGAGRDNPKAVRLPKGSGLLAWYERHATDTGVSVNAALVLALEHYQAAHVGGLDHSTDRERAA
jgi:hypothetical protein